MNSSKKPLNSSIVELVTMGGESPACPPTEGAPEGSFMGRGVRPVSPSLTQYLRKSAQSLYSTAQESLRTIAQIFYRPVQESAPSDRATGSTVTALRPQSASIFFEKEAAWQKKVDAFNNQCSEPRSDEAREQLTRLQDIVVAWHRAGERQKSMNEHIEGTIASASNEKGNILIRINNEFNNPPNRVETIDKALEEDDQIIARYQYRLEIAKSALERSREYCKTSQSLKDRLTKDKDLLEEAIGCSRAIFEYRKTSVVSLPLPFEKEQLLATQTDRDNNKLAIEGLEARLRTIEQLLKDSSQ